MLDAIRRAKDLFTTNKRRWNQMIERGMRKDFSWSASAVKYQELYTELINSVTEDKGEN
jgi:starch synthase